MPEDQLPAEIPEDEVPATVDELGKMFMVRDEKEFDKVASSATWLARLQLMTANAKQCKSGQFPINHFALVRGNALEDLGQEVDAFIISWRPKALDTSGDGASSAHDPDSPEFKRIEAVADSGIPNNGCMHGPEFCVWLPKQQTLATFFWGSKSARIESQLTMSIVKNPSLSNWVTFIPNEIPSKKWGNWWIPTARACSTNYPLPAINSIKEQLDRFNNPPKVQREEVSDDTGGETRAR